MNFIFKPLLFTLCLFGGAMTAIAQEYVDKVTVDGMTYLCYKDGTAELVTGKDGDVTIPSKVTLKGTDYRVEAIGSCAFEERKTTSVVFQEGVKKIEAGAFQVNKKLTSVSLPKSLESIEETAFWECSALETITFQEGLKSIGSSAFYKCAKLKAIALPKTLKNIDGKAFLGCSSLTTATFGEGLTNIGTEAFKGCEKLTEALLPNSLNALEQSAFEGCSALTKVHIGKGLRDIKIDTFSGCTNLTTLTFDKDAELQTIGSERFKGCTKLSALTLPKNLQEIGNSAFENCSGLKSLTLNEGLQSIGTSAFANCTLDGTLEFPESLTTLGTDVFNGCKGLTGVVLKEGLAEIPYQAFYDCTELSTLTLPEGVTKIGNDAFGKCNLTKVVLPSTLTTLEYGAFSYNKNLADVEFHAKNKPFTDEWTAIFYKDANPTFQLRNDAEGYPTEENFKKDLKTQALHIDADGNATVFTDFKYAKPKGWKVSKLRLDGRQIVPTQLECKVAPANAAFLVNADGGDYTLVETQLLQADDLELNDNALKGTAEKTTFGMKDNTTYYVLGSRGGKVGFYWQKGTDGKTLTNAAGKCYLEVVGANGVQGFTLDGDFLTGIDALDTPAIASPQAASLYDLSGRRTNATGKGIFIQNGQKFIR